MMCTGWRIFRGGTGIMRWGFMVCLLCEGECGMFQVLGVIVCGEFASPSLAIYFCARLVARRDFRASPNRGCWGALH